MKICLKKALVIFECIIHIIPPVFHVPKKATEWTQTKDKEILRKRRRDERAARKTYKKQQKLEGQTEVEQVDAVVTEVVEAKE